jgi:hypothetical protein
MVKCEWCGEMKSELVINKDAIGESHQICEKCEGEFITNRKCRKCGTAVDSYTAINGLCSTCIQAEMMIRSKRREEVRLGVSFEEDEDTNRGNELTDADFEAIMCAGSTISVKDIEKDPLLKQLWILTKLLAAGVTEGEEMDKHFKSLGEILDRKLASFIGNKCKVIIINTPEKRREMRLGDVIDCCDEVVVLKANY